MREGERKGGGIGGVTLLDNTVPIVKRVGIYNLVLWVL